MHTFLVTLHILASLTIIVLVLLQHGKGADMGAMLGGGGSQTVFGARGAGNFLTKMTTAAAAIFFVTSLSLSYLSTQDREGSIFDGDDAATPPAAAPAASDLEDVGDRGASTSDSSGLEEIAPPAAEPATPTP